MKILPRLLTFIYLAVVFLMLLAFLSPFINPENFWQLSIISLFTPWLLLINFLFLLFWIFKKRWYAFVSILLFVVGWNGISRYIGFHFSKEETNPSDLTVMSYNIHFLQGLGDYNAKEAARISKLMIPFLKKQGPPTILCAQETYKDNTDLIRKELGYLYVYTHKNKKSATIFSKLPIKAQGDIPFPNSYNAGIWADIAVDSDIIRVFCIHLETNKVTKDAQSLVDNPQIEKEMWYDIRSMLRKYKRAAKARAQQARQIAELVRESPYPVMVCGDFNDSPQSYAYKTIADDLTDAFKEKGAGIGTTYGGKIPGLKIDYILTSPSIEITDHKIIKSKLSDHFPVMSTFVVRNQNDNQ